MNDTIELAQTLNELRWLFYLAIVWELLWKGFALWKAARNGQRNWYIAILVVNSLGILPIIYLIIDKVKSNKKNEMPEELITNLQ